VAATDGEARRSSDRMRRAVLWLVTSALLLALGFGAVVLGLYGLARVLGSIDADAVRTFQVGLVFYFRIVYFQALLPGLIVALLLWPGLVQLLPAVASSRTRLLGGLLLCASVAYVGVGPLLLSAKGEGAPGLRMESFAEQAGTAVLIIAAVAVAAWLPRVFLARLR
jgi:hypothetical protein